MVSPADITQFLNNYQAGQKDAIEHIFPVVYAELKRIAHSQLQKAWSVETICTTSLVNEAYLKLISNEQQNIQNRAHFFAVAATAMRHIIINYAEQKQSQKRGGDWQKVDMNEAFLQHEIQQPEQNLQLLLSINDAVERIKTLDADLAALVEQRFFAGMTEAEVAAVQGVDERTIRRRWQKVKILLAQFLEA